jgi:hypothetical protein
MVFLLDEAGGVVWTVANPLTWIHLPTVLEAFRALNTRIGVSIVKICNK